MPARSYREPTTAPILAALICLLPATGALALDSAELLRDCSDRDKSRQHYCDGYLRAAADASRACVPADIKPSTLKDLALAALGTASDGQQEPAVSVVARRLDAAFPCGIGDASGKEEEAMAAPAAEDQEKKRVDMTLPGEQSPNWSNKSRYGK